jgi:hypothetical protein
MGKILMAVDGTAGSTSVLSVYRTMAREPDSVILVYVQRPGGKSMTTGELQEPEHKEALDRKAETILDFCKQEIENIGPVRSV